MDYAKLKGKNCSKCKEYKLREEFTVDNRRRDKMYCQCKVCVKAYRDLPHVKARKKEYGKYYYENFIKGFPRGTPKN